MQYTLVEHYIGVLSTREHVQRIFTSRPRWNPIHAITCWSPNESMGAGQSVAYQDLCILDRYPQIHGI